MDASIYTNDREAITSVNGLLKTLLQGKTNIDARQRGLERRRGAVDKKMTVEGAVKVEGVKGNTNAVGLKVHRGSEGSAGLAASKAVPNQFEAKTSVAQGRMNGVKAKDTSGAVRSTIGSLGNMNAVGPVATGATVNVVGTKAGVAQGQPVEVKTKATSDAVRASPGAAKLKTAADEPRDHSSNVEKGAESKLGRLSNIEKEAGLRLSPPSLKVRAKTVGFEQRPNPVAAKADSITPSIKTHQPTAAAAESGTAVSRAEASDKQCESFGIATKEHPPVAGASTTKTSNGTTKAETGTADRNEVAIEKVKIKQEVPIKVVKDLLSKTPLSKPNIISSQPNPPPKTPGFKWDTLRQAQSQQDAIAKPSTGDIEKPSKSAIGPIVSKPTSAKNLSRTQTPEKQWRHTFWFRMPYKSTVLRSRLSGHLARLRQSDLWPGMTLEQQIEANQRCISTVTENWLAEARLAAKWKGKEDAMKGGKGDEMKGSKWKGVEWEGDDLGDEALEKMKFTMGLGRMEESALKTVDGHRDKKATRLTLETAKEKRGVQKKDRKEKRKRVRKMAFAPEANALVLEKLPEGWERADVEYDGDLNASD